MRNIFYHATNTEFSKFDPSYGATKGASNGHLGVWVANDRKDCEAYGDFLMTVSIPVKNVFRIPIKRLRQMHDEMRDVPNNEEIDYYKTFSKQLLDEGFTVIDVVEIDGRVAHSILLQHEQIKIEEIEILQREAKSTWGR